MLLNLSNITEEMNREKEILKNIADSVDEYNIVDLSDKDGLSGILRKLNANVFYLTQYKVDARNKWHSIYKNSKATSNAAKAQEADGVVLELKYYRDIIKVADNISNSLRSHISLAKKEGN